MDVKVESATPADFAHAFGLLTQLWPGRHIDYHDARVAFEHVIQSRDQDVLVARNKRGVIVGLVSYSIRHRIEYGGKVLKIDELVVDADKRKRSVGKQLLEAAELIALERDCLGVRLSAEKAGEEARAFFKAMDYEAVDAVRFAKRY